MPLKTIKMLAEDKNYFLRDPALVFYKDFSKSDGLIFPSDDKFGHQLTVTGATWTPQGRSFDIAHDDYITTGDVAALDGFTIGMTLICWVKRSEIGVAHRLFYKYEATGDQRSYGFYFAADNKLYFVVNQLGTDTNNSAGTTGTIADTSFHHLAGVWMPSAHPAIYIDGVLQEITTAGTVKTSIFAGTAPFYLGYTSVSLYGVYGEGAVFNRGFSPNEVVNNMITTRKPWYR